MVEERRKSIILKSEEWFRKMRPLYESLTAIVCGTLEGLIKDQKIDFLSVTGRPKTVDSFIEKIKRKGYQEPNREIHDLCGVRIIVYIESDVSRVAEIVKSSFNSHPDKSLDKTSELGIDRTGYRSIHIVCDLGKKREKLPEYASYKGMIFEVQIRTVLQHAWAEIEHDRNYKFAGVLPDDLQRRFYLAAGTLEMVDREFDSIAKAIDEYAKTVAEKTKMGELAIPIDSTTLSEYFKNKFMGEKRVNYDGSSDEIIISELNCFGIKTIEGLDNLINSEDILQYYDDTIDYSEMGFLRDLMIFKDIDRYFDNCWKNDWKADMSDCSLWKKKYGNKKIEKVIAKHENYVE